MKRFGKRIMSLCLIASFLFSLSACANSSTSSGGDKVIHISISTSYGTTTSNIMKEYSLLEACLPKGYSIEWHFMTSASDMRDALVSGDLDIICTSLPTFITAYENGMPLQLISFAGSVPIGLYGNDPDIASLSDFDSNDRLAAKSKGNNGHIAFLIACQLELGDAMALDDQISTIQESDALALLQSSNDYQASIFSFPMTIKAEKAGLHKIISFNDIIKDYGIGSTYFTRQDFYEQEPEVIAALREAQQQALELIANDPEGVATTLSPIFELEEEYILTALEEMPPCSEYSGYNKLAKLLFDIGLLEKEPTAFEDLANYEDIK